MDGTLVVVGAVNGRVDYIRRRRRSKKKISSRGEERRIMIMGGAVRWVAVAK